MATVAKFGIGGIFMHRKTKRAFLVSLAVALCLSTVSYASPATDSVSANKPVTKQSISETKQITGLVIDARGLGLQRAMSPNIIDTNGRVLNAFPPFDVNWVTKNGAVEYYTDATYAEVANGHSRAGKDFIMIKAVSVRDFGRNVVISADDANKLLDTKGVIYNSKKCNVVFLQ
jgi:hypothetical protein